MAKQGTRGMRDIPTIQGLQSKAIPSSREQLVSEWSRLEHEKARLEREKEIWVQNQKRTETRLQQVLARLEELQVLFGPLGVGKEFVPGRGRRPQAASGTAEAAEGADDSGDTRNPDAAGWHGHTITLEY
jgi:hypothetical protein